MYYYAGRVLHVDLATERSRIAPIDEQTLRAYVGGVGLGTRLLLDELKPGVDPLGPDNVIVLANSAFAGTVVPTATKYAFVAKSPLTGYIGDTISGSFFSQTMKRADWDAIVITGKARRLSYLFIDDDRAYVRDAAALKGMDCWDTEEAIRHEIDDQMVKVASIGLAGENLVRYACLGNDKGRQAGRTGPGAVMGSKNLKAIAIRGSKPIKVANSRELFELCVAYGKVSQGPLTQKYRAPGTVGNVLTCQHLGILPTRNFQSGVFAHAEEVSGERMMKLYTEKSIACAGCTIACEQVAKAHEAPYNDARVSVDYESLWALGPLCGVHNMDAIIKACDLCDRYGLDTMSTGVVIAWAMECFERGILTRDDTDGLDLSWGDHGSVIALIHKIVRREPGIGDLLADGVKRASEKVGQGSEAFAMHGKGLELAGYEPRGLQTYALGMAVGTRGSCHNRSPGYEPDMGGKVNRFVAEASRGQLVKDLEDYAAAFDSLVICKFFRKCFTDFWSEAAHLYELSTGLSMSADDLRKVGERVCNIKKLFNIREGWTVAEDWLPARCFDDPLPEGASAGQAIKREDLRMMIDAYYQARGWTADGLIPAEKLAALDLSDVADRAGVNVPQAAGVAP